MLQLDGRLLTPSAEGIGFQWEKGPEGRFVRPVGHTFEVPRRGAPPGLGSSATWRRRACRQRALLCVDRVTCGRCACVGLRTVDAATQTNDGQQVPDDTRRHFAQLHSSAELATQTNDGQHVPDDTRRHFAQLHSSAELVQSTGMQDTVLDMQQFRSLDESVAATDADPRVVIDDLHWVQLQYPVKAASHAEVRWTIDEFHEYAKACWCLATADGSDFGRVELHAGVLVADATVIHVESVKLSQVLEVIRQMEDGSWHDVQKVHQGINQRVGRFVDFGTVMEMIQRLVGSGWVEVKETSVRERMPDGEMLELIQE